MFLDEQAFSLKMC